MPDTPEHYDSFKQLILAVLSGKRPRRGWSRPLLDRSAERAVIREALADKHPDIVAELRKYKRNPVVSTTSLLKMDLERKHLDMMIAAAGGTLMSIGHDGIVVRGASKDTIKSMWDATLWPVRVIRF